MKLSYSCMPNMSSIIANHNKKLLNKMPDKAEKLQLQRSREVPPKWKMSNLVSSLQSNGGRRRIKKRLHWIGCNNLQN